MWTNTASGVDIVEKTYVIKGKTEPSWVLVDAKGQKLGRLATQIAHMLMGKNRPDYTPGVDMGGHVVVTNVHSLSISQDRLIEKMYYTHSGYPGGIHSTNMRDLLAKHPDRVIRHAVWGMLPHNKLGRLLIKRIRVYAGSEHEQQAQKPQPIA